ncbi:MAG TPA: DUF6057 family protein [Bacteroidota bacterium]|nr:DUF6057 family protein [Bacteroidota bacterium]
MTGSDKNRVSAKIDVWIQEYLVFTACFLYFLLGVHPKLILELQFPAFLMDVNFLKDFLQIPGGLMDGLSAFIMRFWLSDFIISVFLTLCCWCVAFFTRKWLEVLTANRFFHTFHLIPAVLLAFLHSQYDFNLSITLAFIVNLAFLNLIIRWNPKQVVLQIIVDIIAIVFLFWITGGAFLIYGVLFGLHELIVKKRYINGLFILVFSSLLPYVASSSIILITLKQAYLHNLIPENSIKFLSIAYIIPLFYILVYVIASFTKIGAVTKSFEKITGFIRLGKLNIRWQCVLGTLLIICGTILLTDITYDNNQRLDLELNQYMQDGRWDDAIHTARQCTVASPFLFHQINLALFQSGTLLDNMFSFQQYFGSSGLIMDFNWRSYSPAKTSDFYWKLGLINESLHWAHEALELKGPTPEILKRLGMAYMIKGDHIAAKRFFLNLKNVPFYEKTADDLIRLNDSPSELAQVRDAQYIQSYMLSKDYIHLNTTSSAELELLLNRNPSNKMAFEYLMAYYLLTGNLNGIVNYLPAFGFFRYSHIPRYIQEALLIASLKSNFDQNKLNNLVQPITRQYFLNYQQILNKYKGNIYDAAPELQAQFADTYWYYLMYVRPEARQSEMKNEFQ